MGYVRYFRRVHVAPGLTVNLAKTGPSLSMGVRGAHLTVGRTGIRRTVGIPGSGAFYTSHTGWHSGVHTADHFTSGTPAPAVQHHTAYTIGKIIGRTIEIVGVSLAAILGVMLVLAGGGSRRRR